MMKEVLTLTGLQSMIKTAVSGAFPALCWVKAEIHDLKVNMSGHCYIDLVENAPDGQSFRARASAVVWASKWRVLGVYFRETAGRPLARGMNVLVRVRVQYSELYGMNLVVEDIDPAFTVGEAELRRQETVARLKAEGMFDMNAAMEIPRIVRCFAVISSDTAAGYGDFVRHIEDNGYGFRFRYRLYPAPMQGDSAPAGIVSALEQVYSDSCQGAGYDAVLILRGGGSNADLACYDDYTLAANIAQFPIPVFAAIGHERDVHVCDMVAAKSVKTPTALADFILEQAVSEDSMLASYSDRLMQAMRLKIKREENRLDNMARRLYSAFAVRAGNEEAKLKILELRLKKSDPVEVLASGYALVYRNGAKVPAVSGLSAGDTVEVRFSDGTALCKIENINR